MIARLNHNYFSRKCHCKAAWLSSANVVEIKILLAECYCFTYLIIIKFVGILIFLNRVMYTRGYPSEFISYILENICTAQIGLVYKNFLLLYMRKYKPVYSLVYELSVQAQSTIKMAYKNCKLACRFSSYTKL